MSYAAAVEIASAWHVRAISSEPHALADSYAAAPAGEQANRLAWLLWCAKRSARADTALRLIVKRCGRLGQPPPPVLVKAALREFVNGKLAGARRPGRPREHSPEVVEALRDLRSRGYRPLSRRVELGDPISACDAVATAFGLEYRQIANAWQGYRQWEREPIPDNVRRWLGHGN